MIPFIDGFGVVCSSRFLDRMFVQFSSFRLSLAQIVTGASVMKVVSYVRNPMGRWSMNH